jgi:hypothetical protein
MGDCADAGDTAVNASGSAAATDGASTPRIRGYREGRDEGNSRLCQQTFRLLDDSFGEGHRVGRMEVTAKAEINTVAGQSQVLGFFSFSRRRGRLDDSTLKTGLKRRGSERPGRRRKHGKRRGWDQVDGGRGSNRLKSKGYSDDNETRARELWTEAFLDITAPEADQSSEGWRGDKGRFGGGLTRWSRRQVQA